MILVQQSSKDSHWEGSRETSGKRLSISSKRHRCSKSNSYFHETSRIGEDRSSAERSSTSHQEEGDEQYSGSMCLNNSAANIFVNSAGSEAEKDDQIPLKRFGIVADGSTPVSFGGLAKSHPITQQHSRRPSFSTALYTTIGNKNNTNKFMQI